jgi:hypothetical protein
VIHPAGDNEFSFDHFLAWLTGPDFEDNSKLHVQANVIKQKLLCPAYADVLIKKREEIEFRGPLKLDLNLTVGTVGEAPVDVVSWKTEKREGKGRLNSKEKNSHRNTRGGKGRQEEIFPRANSIIESDGYMEMIFECLPDVDEEDLGRLRDVFDFISSPSESELEDMSPQLKKYFRKRQKYFKIKHNKKFISGLTDTQCAYLTREELCRFFLLSVFCISDSRKILPGPRGNFCREVSRFFFFKMRVT